MLTLHTHFMIRNKLLNPRGFQTSNKLDNRIYRERIKSLQKVCEIAKSVRQNCTEMEQALTTIQEIFDVVQDIVHEVLYVIYN